MADEELTPMGKAAQEFGRMYVAALVQNAKLPAEPGYFTLRQDDLTNIAAAAFEIGARWRQDASGCERGRGSVMACGSSPMCGCPAALAELERNPDAFGVPRLNEPNSNGGA